MENISEAKNTLQALSHDLAAVVEQVSPSVVAVNARRHLSSTGIYWLDGVIVTAAHTLKRSEDISVILASGQTVTASLAGTDPSTDLAVLKIDRGILSTPPFGDTSQLKVGHLVLAVGRGAQRGLNAALAIVGVLSGAWRTWRGGLMDQFIGLDVNLHPGAAGGPLDRRSRERLGYEHLRAVAQYGINCSCFYSESCSRASAGKRTRGPGLSGVGHAPHSHSGRS